MSYSSSSNNVISRPGASPSRPSRPGNNPGGGPLGPRMLANNTSHSSSPNFAVPKQPASASRPPMPTHKSADTMDVAVPPRPFPPNSPRTSARVALPVQNRNPPSPSVPPRNSQPQQPPSPRGHQAYAPPGSPSSIQARRASEASSPAPTRSGAAAQPPSLVRKLSAPDKMINPYQQPPPSSHNPRSSPSTTAPPNPFASSGNYNTEQPRPHHHAPAPHPLSSPRAHNYDDIPTDTRPMQRAAPIPTLEVKQARELEAQVVRTLGISVEDATDGPESYAFKAGVVRSEEEDQFNMLTFNPKRAKQRPQLASLGGGTIHDDEDGSDNDDDGVLIFSEDDEALVVAPTVHDSLSFAATQGDMPGKPGACEALIASFLHKNEKRMEFADAIADKRLSRMSSSADVQTPNPSTPSAAPSEAPPVSARATVPPRSPVPSSKTDKKKYGKVKVGKASAVAPEDPVGDGDPRITMVTSRQKLHIGLAELANEQEMRRLITGAFTNST